jgi:outer membrane biosynthesis protein TonB
MIRALTAAAVLLAACPKPAPEAPPPVPDDVPRHDPDGPVAGPHEVVEGDPPEVAPDTPGAWGPLRPYIATVRRPVTDRMLACMQKAPAVVTDGPALVVATIGEGGELRQVTLSRSSGAEPLDTCILQAFRQAELPVPPPEILGDGVVAFEMAFR